MQRIKKIFLELNPFRSKIEALIFWHSKTQNLDVKLCSKSKTDETKLVKIFLKHFSTFPFCQLCLVGNRTRVLQNKCHLMPNCRAKQCDQIGQFFKFLAAHFDCKAAQILLNFLGYFKVCHFCRNNCFGYFLGNYWKIWVTIYSSIRSHCCYIIIDY